ncbi:uncharacterized protein LOC143352608 isoform X2 [Halictus rubicundus]|uniref:uncharacterized protein LOC143352608 isoform X2 n=1 Tax=Halictus rubicundus TaxID=77578 RepID=UPI00403546D9
MHSKTDRSSYHGAQGVEGNLEEVEDTESAALENSQELKETESVKRVIELSTIGTQTPLTLVRLTVTQSSSRKQFTDSTTLPTRFSYETGHDLEESRENGKSFARKLLQSKTSATLSHEATTQATPPHPSLMPKTSQDTMQMSASLTSSACGQKNEVLTVTTDYAASSPDARSLLVHVVNESDNDDAPNSYGRSSAMDAISSSNRDTTSSSLSSLESSNQQWSLASCLQCVPIVNDETYTRARMRDAPPTYSSIFARRPPMRNWGPFRSTNRSSFVAPIPPPSYAQAQAQAQGMGLASFSMDQLFSTSPNANRLWTPRPTTAVCPRCTAIIVTTVEVRQSVITHITAFVLLLCGCWPCCILPYCLSSCNNIDHYCPVCRAHLGTYRPC